ncbi:hypothetical protein DFH07DRAFT_766390 [Mycena maculata]|uniref:Uncharacterized protein n=1 Tax=Mycena maculata TaxID=230809 RepID=A0AAD7IAH5_9AGAR|nr:hypothetical protein DFH07DRAFT_778974 [Mycena maculata]KAJ7777640.1 hypothetical protein DFH07DRAFT_766390 [Mycena maculata]
MMDGRHRNVWGIWYTVTPHGVTAWAITQFSIACTGDLRTLKERRGELEQDLNGVNSTKNRALSKRRKVRIKFRKNGLRFRRASKRELEQTSGQKRSGMDQKIDVTPWGVKAAQCPRRSGGNPVHHF